MNRTLDCMKESKLETIFLECDQVIYNKVMFKFKQEGSHRFDPIVVRIGGFHISICLMKAIYSRFKGSGMVELLSDAGVGTEGTIKSGMNGTYVKQGIRYYKLIFEALLRTKLDYIEDAAVGTPHNDGRPSTVTHNKNTMHTANNPESAKVIFWRSSMSSYPGLNRLKHELLLHIQCI
jgi:hypothetical protein